MVMSTTEQQTFETALVTPTSLDTIKAGLSKVDVRQVHGDMGTAWGRYTPLIYPVSMPEQPLMPERSCQSAHARGP